MSSSISRAAGRTDHPRIAGERGAPRTRQGVLGRTQHDEPEFAGRPDPAPTRRSASALRSNAHTDAPARVESLLRRRTPPLPQGMSVRPRAGRAYLLWSGAVRRPCFRSCSSPLLRGARRQASSCHICRARCSPPRRHSDDRRGFAEPLALSAPYQIPLAVAIGWVGVGLGTEPGGARAKVIHWTILRMASGRARVAFAVAWCGGDVVRAAWAARSAV
jgi:hypothetical protein